MKTSKVENLISSLSNEASATKKLWKVKNQLFLWMGVSFLSTILFFYILNLNTHFSEQLENPLFLIELIVGLIVVLVSAYTAIRLSRPDLGDNTKILSLVTISGWSVIIAIGITMGPEWMGFEAWLSHLNSFCFRIVLLVGLLPALVLFGVIRFGAPTQLGWAGFLSAVSGAGIGVISLRMSCLYDDPLHILVAHVLPALILIGIGGLLARKVFKW